MKLLKLLLLPIGAVLTLWLTIYLYQEGLLTDYWESRDALWDPRLKIYRCLDEHGQIDPQDRQPPCSVITLAGQRFGERRIANCLAKGGIEKDCAREAWEWVKAMRPEERGKVHEKPRGSISERSQ
ncbi:MAG: hypothetical protein RL768_2789 [Nitrospirota bacterium]|jgi:hypothetical protein